MGKCVNCFNEGADTTCATCKSEIHKNCSGTCRICGKNLCDECFIKNNGLCEECINVDKFEMDFISSTMFNAFIKCPFKFYHEQIVDEKYKSMDNEEFDNKYSKTGSLLHELFDKYSKIEVKPDQEDLFREYAKEFIKIDKNLFEDNKDRKNFLEKGQRTIENWLEEEQTKPLPLYTEKKHLVKLHDDLPLIRGTIDRINGDKDDVANWEVEDYKTGKVYTSNMLREGFQLPIYAMIIKETYGDLPKILRLRFPQHQKERTFKRVSDDEYVCDVKRGGTYSFSLKEKLKQMIKIYDDIKKGKFVCNTNQKHFCEGFCEIKKKGLCEGINNIYNMPLK